MQTKLNIGFTSKISPNNNTRASRQNPNPALDFVVENNLNLNYSLSAVHGRMLAFGCGKCKFSQAAKEKILKFLENKIEHPLGKDLTPHEVSEFIKGKTKTISDDIRKFLQKEVNIAHEEYERTPVSAGRVSQQNFTPEKKDRIRGMLKTYFDIPHALTEDLSKENFARKMNFYFDASSHSEDIRAGLQAFLRELEEIDRNTTLALIKPHMHLESVHPMAAALASEIKNLKDADSFLEAIELSDYKEDIIGILMSTEIFRLAKRFNNDKFTNRVLNLVEPQMTDRYTQQWAINFANSVDDHQVKSRILDMIIDKGSQNPVMSNDFAEKIIKISDDPVILQKALKIIDINKISYELQEALFNKACRLLEIRPQGFKAFVDESERFLDDPDKLEYSEGLKEALEELGEYIEPDFAERLRGRHVPSLFDLSVKKLKEIIKSGEMTEDQLKEILVKNKAFRTIIEPTGIIPKRVLNSLPSE